MNLIENKPQLKDHTTSVGTIGRLNKLILLNKHFELAAIRKIIAAYMAFSRGPKSVEDPFDGFLSSNEALYTSKRFYW